MNHQYRWQFTGRFSGDLEIERDDCVDLVLRSSAEAARRTMRMTRIWEGDIILGDVDVTWKDPR